MKGEKDIVFINISWGLGSAFIIDGKIYSVSAGDVLYLPANVPHGAFIEEDCRVIDVFCPCREDYMQKFVEQHPDSVTYFRTV